MLTKITRLADNKFRVETDTVMSDGTMRADYCKLQAGALVPADGYYRVSGGITVKLSDARCAQLLGLGVGESVAPNV